MTGYTDGGEAKSGYLEVVKELQERFPHPEEIVKEADKKEFVKLFGQFLKLDNILRNYDEYTQLQVLQTIDVEDQSQLDAFVQKYQLDKEQLDLLIDAPFPTPRQIQDYRSTYNDIKDWYHNERRNIEDEKSKVNWDEITFEVELLKSQEINLDYILELILETNKKVSTKSDLIEEITRTIRASLGNRAKEDLIVDFIHQTDIDSIVDKSDIIERFFAFARKEQAKEVEQLIKDENLNEANAKRYIKTSLKREYASENGTELNETLPKLSPLNPTYRTKKQTVFEKISQLVEKYKGVGGDF